MSEVLAKSEVMPVIPKSVWLRVGNCETPGRFKVVVEVNGGEYERVVYDSIDECDGNISQHTNLAWLIEEPSQKVEGEPFAEMKKLFSSPEAMQMAVDKITSLKEQLEQANAMKEMHDFGWQCYQDRCEGAFVEATVVKRLREELGQANDLIHAEDGYIASQDYLREQLTQAQAELGQMKERDEWWKFNLESCRSETNETHAELMKAQAEAAKYKAALESIAQETGTPYARIASEALKTEEKV